MMHTELTLRDAKTVELRFGPAALNLSVEAAYEFQYQLAEFLADLEREEDSRYAELGEAELEQECADASHDNLLTLSNYR